MKLPSIETKKKYQRKFFDEHPSLYPWPHLLVEAGFSQNYKPRDVKFRKYLNLLGMKSGEKVLDVGCGTGTFLARVAKTYGVDCTGIDVSKESIAKAKQWLVPCLHFQVADAVKLPFEDESFDYVLSFDVLEHIEDQNKALSEMARVLKRGGWLLIYTINKNQRYTWHFWLAKLGVPVGKRAAHNPSLFLDPDWVKEKLGKLGIRIERLEPFNSFFTLAADEMIMVFVLSFKRLNLFDSSSRFKILLGRIFLNFANLFSHLLFTPLAVLEIPWKKSGYSNSFFVLGKKK